MKAVIFFRQFESMSVGMAGNAFRKANALLLLSLLAFPFAAEAQVDDVYFVPKKEKEKVLVVKSVTEKYVVEDDATLRDVDEYNRRSVGYTDDPELYIEENLTEEYAVDDYEDYDYSTRIIRFRNPNRAIASTIYWDLNYGCGLSDWMVIDNGYSIDIYPTVNNPLFILDATSYVWNSLTYYNWRTWYNRCYWDYRPYWAWNYPHYHSCYDPWYYGSSFYYNHYYAPHYDRYHSTLYRPRRDRAYIPSNGSVSGGRRTLKDNKPYANTGGRGDRGGNKNRFDNDKRGGVDLRGVNKKNNRNDKVAVNQDKNKNGKGENNGRVNLRGTNNDRNKVNAGTQNGRTKELRIGNRSNNGNERRNQQVRQTENNNRTRGITVGGNNGGRVRGNNQSSGSQNRNTVNRRTPSANGGYNRPSSTSVTKSRNTRGSESGYSSGSSRSSRSSYSSGSSRSSRSSGSSYSSGSSSRSSGGFSGGGSSRSSGGGGGGGRRR